MAEEKPKKIERESLEKFFRTCIDLLASESMREKLRNDSPDRPRSALVNDAQDAVWDDLGVPRGSGRQAVEMIDHFFPGDSALVSLRSEFAKASDATYWQCLEDRRPSELETKAKLPRSVMLDFYTASTCKMRTPEVTEQLKATIAETGQFPETVIDGVLGDIQELLGWEREHAKKCCQTSVEDFAKDRELIHSHSVWTQQIEYHCLNLMNDFRKEGGRLKVGEVLAGKLLEFQAKSELDELSNSDRMELLDKTHKKVSVFRKLPPEGRMRYLSTLSEEEKLELAKGEILMVTVMQAQHQAAVDARVAQAQNLD